MMEISHGSRGERHQGDGHDHHQDPSRNPNFSPSPSSSSSTCWIPQAEFTDPPVEAAEAVEWEHMFDKVVTPSDVGKLNRLVIPKQHAEKYFPLDPATGDKGLLLCFEESPGGSGKAWRFRYSYWNSSQSYVMTKGWSRFVKDKGLDPGDTVSFARGLGESGRGRLFIDWRRRPPDPRRSVLGPVGHTHPMLPLGSVVVPWSHGVQFGSASPSFNMGQYRNFISEPLLPLHARMQFGVGGAVQAPPMVLDSVPVGREKTEPTKRVRLFGVNLECSEPEEEVDEDRQRLVRSKPPLSPLRWRSEASSSDPKPSVELDLLPKG